MTETEINKAAYELTLIIMQDILTNIKKNYYN